MSVRSQERHGGPEWGWGAGSRRSRGGRRRNQARPHEIPGLDFPRAGRLCHGGRHRGGPRPGRAGREAKRRKAAGGRVGRGAGGVGESPRSRGCQRRAWGWWPGGGSGVLGARLGLRTPLRGDWQTIPSASASASTSVLAAAASSRRLPPPPSSSCTMPPLPDSRSPGAAAAKSSVAHWLPAAAPAGKCSPGFRAQGPKGGRGESAGRGGVALARIRDAGGGRASRREARPQAIQAEAGRVDTNKS